jgi:cytochrome c-type biogenesis protein CcmH/NrfG
MRLLGFIEGCMHWLLAGNLSRRATNARGSSIFVWGSALAMVAGPWVSYGQELEQAQKEFLSGQYETVAKTAWKKVQAGSYEEGWRVLLVEAELAVGSYAAANSNTVAAVDDFPGNIQLRLLARETALYQNDRPGAARQLDEIKDLIERRGRSAQTGENLVALGRALLLLGVEPRLVLENCFRRAYDMYPAVREAYLAGGQLALDKHDFKLAADTFRAGLKKFPGDPDMEWGLAAAFQNSDREEMLKALRAALAVNPRHIPSLLLLASHLVDAEQYDEAEKQLGLALAVNPWQPEALACRAAIAALRNQPDKADAFRAKALLHWKTNPRVDYLLGLKLSQNYRFQEGAAAQRRALAFDPEYLPARRELAQDLLRLGQEDEGWKLVQDTRTEDQYDVTLYNLATLHDQMAKFRTVTNRDFILRMSALESALYSERVLGLLQKARVSLCPKYGVELTKPTVVDIFPNQKDFAVCTFGMPGNPGYLGVCFGSVITANSPASQAPNPANWEDVLWHEFCHVVTLTATRNRMPRWLSEGLSVYEERQANRGWGEHMNLAYREMILHGGLTPLGKLSGAFLQPKNSQALQFAYFESSLVVEFLVEKFGLDTVRTILSDLREGREINQAIASNTLPLPELEKQFTAFATERAQALAPGADLAKPPADADEAALAAWEKAHPNNYFLMMRKARDLMEAKHWPEAKALLESVAASYHGEAKEENPLWLEAITERHLNETNGEWQTLETLAQQEADFVDLDLRLIGLAGARQDWRAEGDYAGRLLQLDPLLPAPYRALAAAGVATGNGDQAIDAYRKLLLLHPTDPVEVHFQLARLLHARGGAEAEAKRQVIEALEDAPRYRNAQRLLLEIEAGPAKAPPSPQSASN